MQNKDELLGMALLGYKCVVSQLLDKIEEINQELRGKSPAEKPAAAAPRRKMSPSSLATAGAPPA